MRRADDLSRLVRAATGSSVNLTHVEFDAVRRLLEDRQTWSMLGRGTVENLAARIATCLPPGEGRTGEDADTAAMSIARGLLEFAVADLDPKVFQQLLLARLDRMETSEASALASALDSAMLDLHADLMTRFTRARASPIASPVSATQIACWPLPPGSRDQSPCLQPLWSRILAAAAG